MTVTDLYSIIMEGFTVDVNEDWKAIFHHRYDDEIELIPEKNNEASEESILVPLAKNEPYAPQIEIKKPETRKKDSRRTPKEIDACQGTISSSNEVLKPRKNVQRMIIPRPRTLPKRKMKVPREVHVVREAAPTPMPLKKKEENKSLANHDNYLWKRNESQRESKRAAYAYRNKQDPPEEHVRSPIS